MRKEVDSMPQQRGELLLACGLIGLVGAMAPLLTMVWATFAAEHDFVADTLSDLGRGPHRVIMDTGFYIAAAAMISLAIGSAHAHLGRWGWSLGLFCLAGLALVITLLGVWDHFHATLSEAQSMSVHTRLTFLLAPLYLAGPLLMAPGAGRVHRRYRAAFHASAALFVVFTVAYKLAPEGYDGLLEKIALAATWLWTLPLGWLLLDRGRASVGQG